MKGAISSIPGKAFIVGVFVECVPGHGHVGIDAVVNSDIVNVNVSIIGRTGSVTDLNFIGERIVIHTVSPDQLAINPEPPLVTLSDGVIDMPLGGIRCGNRRIGQPANILSDTKTVVSASAEEPPISAFTVGVTKRDAAAL